MRTVKELLTKGEQVWVLLQSENVGKLFLQNAQSEGFTFGDGEKPTNREYAEIIAIHDDFTISYVGYVGHLAFHNNDSNITRVDYSRYLAGHKKYIIRGFRGKAKVFR